MLYRIVMFFDKRDWRTWWGHTFEWTPNHLTPEQLRPFIFKYDVLGAECLDRIDEISPPASRTAIRNTDTSQKPENYGGDNSDEKKAQRDLYALLEEHHLKDSKLDDLWNEIHTIPEWVDWDQIQRGQDVFYRYGGPAIISLTFQSLVGGMGGRRVVETLSKTGGFGVKVARRRLLETFQHVLQVTKDLESIQPGGEGFASSIRVRFLHAAVRRRILGLVKERPNYFDVETYGVPVNDLDSIGTILTFSAALIWLGLPRQGIYLRPQEILDYTALWRWIAHLLGTPTEPFLSTPQRAKAMLESLGAADLDPSDMSKVLANNILTGLSAEPPTFASREFLCAEAHWLNGYELADALGIQRPSLYHRSLVAAQCLYFMFTCYLWRSIPSWDKQKNERVRNFFYNMTVNNKTLGLGGHRSKFEFKYVPQLDSTTEPGQQQDSGLAAAGVERQNLKVLLTAVTAATVLGTVAWLGFRSVTGTLHSA